MKLTRSQIEQYNEKGYLVFPELLSMDEVNLLREELTAAAGIRDDRVIREKSGEAVRMVYGVHDQSGPVGSLAYEKLVRAGRLLQPAMDVIGEPVNVFQTKANLKEAVNGEFWQWHQDYGYWITDGAEEPRMTTSLVMLDKATEVGGCLYFVPGSHKLGLIPAEFDERTSVKIWIVPKAKMIEAVEQYGEPEAITGEPGTVVIFHPYIVHGSGWNMSTHDRRQVYIVYNAESNKLKPVANPRPEFKAARHALTLVAVNEESILEQEEVQDS